MSHIGRQACMTLDVVERAGKKDVAIDKYPTGSDKRFSTEDIEGAKPCYPWKQYLDRPTPSCMKDIPESKAPSLYAHQHRAIDLSMTTDDIDWARPKVNRFRTSRVTNPMDPHYVLPSAVACPPDIPSYSGRPTLDVSDISGAQPKRLIREKAIAVKDEVEFASPNYFRRRVRPIPTHGFGNTLDVSDITLGDNKAVDPRCTNPLEPVYIVDQRFTGAVNSACKSKEYTTLQPLIAGHVPMSKPREIYRGEPHRSAILDNSDILGSSSQRFSGTLPINVYSKLMIGKGLGSITSDIPGAQTGTLHRGLRTQRRTNPLDPQYRHV